MKVAQTFDRLLRATQSVKRKIKLLAVRHAQEKVTNAASRVSLCSQISKRIVVTLRLRHGLTLDLEMFEVKPVVDELLSGGSFTLRNLVFVMRKNQVDAPRVDVEGFTQVLH